MEIQGWKYYNHAAVPSTWPHEDVDLIPVKNGNIWKLGGGKSVLARWTSDFDCSEETQFYWCIKDDSFDLAALKAKRRYEINKGIKHFETRIIDPRQYVNEIYDVYIDSLKGYPGHITPVSRERIERSAYNGWAQKECRFFAAFDRKTGCMCGYSDVYERGRFLPISSLHCRTDSEKNGVNLALVFAIVDWYCKLDIPGRYLCDGARNVLHETHFQDFLIKYFGFRKAYCHLHIIYRPAVHSLIAVCFPFRKWIGAIPHRVAKQVYAVLKMEAWKRGLDC